MRRSLLVLAAVVTLIAWSGPPSGATPRTSAGETRHFLVLYDNGTSLSAGRAAIEAAGGTLTHVNGTIGLAEVVSDNPDFLASVRTQDGVKGASRDRSIGTARPGMGHQFADERLVGQQVRGKPKP